MNKRSTHLRAIYLRFTHRKIVLLAVFLCVSYVCIVSISHISFWERNSFGSHPLTSTAPNMAYPVASTVTFKKHTHDTLFNVLLADTPELQQRGLGGRTNLKDDDVMLFVFDENKNKNECEYADKYMNEDEEHFFWMKDMLFSIDMVWLDKDKKVIHIEQRVSPSTYPISFGPDEGSRFVLEFNAGTTEKIDLRVGDTLSF